jgi:hypothetical protein
MDDVGERVDPIRRERDRDEQRDRNARTFAFQQRRDRGVPRVHSARPSQQAVENGEPDPRREQGDADDETGGEPLNTRRRTDDHAERSLSTAAPDCCASERIPRRVLRWR